MKKLELYIGTGDNGSHFFTVRDGVRSERLDFSSTDVNSMYAEAVRLLKADPAFGNEVRIIDVTHSVVKSGSMTAKLETLEMGNRLMTEVERRVSMAGAC